MVNWGFFLKVYLRIQFCLTAHIPQLLQAGSLPAPTLHPPPNIHPLPKLFLRVPFADTNVEPSFTLLWGSSLSAFLNSLNNHKAGRLIVICYSLGRSYTWKNVPEPCQQNSGLDKIDGDKCSGWASLKQMQEGPAIVPGPVASRCQNVNA